MLNVITAIALSLLASSLVAVFSTRSARQRGIEEGRRQAIEAYRREQEAAVRLLLSRLTNLITRPCDDEAAPTRAESVVGLIRSYQSAIADLCTPLASQIDRLQNALATLRQDSDTANARDEIRDALTDLRDVWPEKKLEVELRLRDLLGQLTTIDGYPLPEMDRGPRKD
jgi:hypothetical protein